MSVNRSFPLVYLYTNEHYDFHSCLVHMSVLPSPLSRDALMMVFPFGSGLTLLRLLEVLNETRQTHRPGFFGNLFVENVYVPHEIWGELTN